MMSTWIGGQEDGHAPQVAINAVTGEVKGEPVAVIWAFGLATNEPFSELCTK